MNSQKLFKTDADGYFNDLSNPIKALVKELCIETMEINDFYSDIHDSVEEIECESRDGFIPYDHNRGGIVIRTFTDIISIWGSGNYPNHVGARAEIERQIEMGLDSVAHDTFDKFQYALTNYGLAETDCHYHTIRDFNEKNDNVLKEVEKYIEESEINYLGDTDNSVMYEVRFMYHGKVNGIHSASVSCAVNTEGPYHRSSISWAPGVFCEGSKEIEFTWLTVKELERKLKSALNQTSKAIF